ncbi:MULTISPECIES: PAS domain-containing sensor histidine kinase [unclassified Rhizobium]|uniref:hybrid sensor histidine kinase/response regulator n=1 Tax=unclassified Rhizobium TaxID=2613769 RepID=UPI0021695F52|nr:MULTISPECIES: PAS domain-containing sensor histidine kinase [unclassified Rhizobium]MCS3743576.1 PAS domain S-box-containing protein [Rhizobium sp. BK661]MCS4096538.1 PAS domain S-box-containing protein [Rhizobium sp. BK176]
MPVDATVPFAPAQDLDVIARVFDDTSVIIHGVDGVISHWTSGSERLYGWKRAEAVGQVVHRLLRTKLPRPIEDIRRDVFAGLSWEGDIVHRHKDGHPMTIATRWVVFDAKSSSPVVIQTNTDVSETRKIQDDLAEREAHLRSILDTVPDSMVVVDESGSITSFSSAAEKLFGYSSREVIGRNVRMLMPSPFREEHDRYIADYLRTGRGRIIGLGRVVKGRKKDGSLFPMELAVGEAVSNETRIFTGFVRDLTGRQRIEEELRQSQKMEAVGQLTGGLAHDFNNLLTVISGNLEMLESLLEGDYQHELLREAQDAVHDGAKLTSQLLSFGRRQPLEPESTDVGSLVSGFSELLRRSLGETIELRTSIRGSKHMAMVDKSQLQAALLNLALNARDAMPGGGSLTLDISRVELDADYAQMYPEVKPGNYILVAVTDTGEGMSEEVKNRAFEPFFTTKGIGAGTGLGLSMVYGFVKQLGGHIQLYSELDKGTTVRIYLPAVGAEVTPQLGKTSGGEDGAGGSEHILVVEDDERVRRVVVARLVNAGYSVLEAPDATRALELLSSTEPIDLLFTDIVMPGGMTGDELARQATLYRPDLKVLFTSGYAEPSIAKRSLPISSWLKKPYTAQELSSRLRQLLN